MVSHLQVCQRAFVSALLAAAARLQVAPGVNRDSDPQALREACSKVFRKAARSRDGQDLRPLRAAKAEWESALGQRDARGRPCASEAGYRVEATAVLLTYQSFDGLDQWRRFACFVQQKTSTWQVKYWCATLEKCKTGRLHAHVTPVCLPLQVSDPRNGCQGKVQTHSSAH